MSPRGSIRLGWYKNLTDIAIGVPAIVVPTARASATSPPSGGTAPVRLFYLAIDQGEHRIGKRLRY